MDSVNTVFTLPTTKKHHFSLQLVDAENERRMLFLSTFAPCQINLKTDVPDGIELGKRRNEKSIISFGCTDWYFLCCKRTTR